jgi:Tfp pilus assembly protein PilN
MRPVNLIPADQRRRAPREGSGSGKAAYAALGILALLLAMVVAYVLTSNTVTERESDAASASAEADRLEAQAAKKSTFVGFAEIAQTRMASVAGVAETRFDWERFMRELSKVMPSGSWLQSADASVLGDASEDPAAAAAAAGGTAAPAAPSASLVGCTPGQTDVARMMVRLRQLHRVDDVQLQESAKENATGEAAVDNCGSKYKFDITVTFSPAPPTSEAPRGENRVPAALGGGS